MGAGDGNDLIYTQYGVNLFGIVQSFLNFFSGNSIAADSVYGYLVSAWWIFSLLAFLLSGLLLYGVIYAKMRLHELEHAQEHMLEHAEEHYAHEHGHGHGHGSKNKRWDDALHHGESDNPNDWRLAIIEADIMLEEALEKLGYSGLTIGDKLKQASPQFFRTIDDAWKAHKVRNEIAHRGSDFILTKRLAKETLDQYRRVFEEFDVV